MPTISKNKIDKISEQILHYLFSVSPDSRFTSDIAKEIARDEEFTKSILIQLLSKNLVVTISSNKDGIKYLRRQRWRLSSQAFDVYSRAQSRRNQLQDNNLYKK